MEKEENEKKTKREKILKKESSIIKLLFFIFSIF